MKTGVRTAFLARFYAKLCVLSSILLNLNKRDIHIMSIDNEGAVLGATSASGVAAVATLAETGIGAVYVAIIGLVTVSLAILTFRFATQEVPSDDGSQ